MEEGDFTHPGLRMIRDSQSLTILLPVKADRFRRLLHLIWFGVWVAGEAALLAALLGWKAVLAPPKPVLVVFLAAFTVAGVYVLYRLLWYMAGREVFAITRDEMAIRREIWNFGRSWRFGRRAIRRISAQRLNYDVVYPSWGRMFIGHGEGEIVIEGHGATYVYGKGLDEDEARGLANLMQQELSLRSSDRRPSEVRAG